MENPEDLLTYREVGERLKVARSTVLRLCAEGKLPVIYLSKRTPRIMRRDLEAYIASQRRILNPIVGADDEAL